MWFVLYGLFLLASVDARGLPVVETNYGTVRGKWLSSARNLSVAAYLGIPYAAPPIGELRFQSPQPWTQNWTDMRDATEDGSKCVQLDRQGNTLGNEDCLYLNIFVPLIVNKQKLPVLVFVHGGGFNVGSNNSTYFAPDYLMDQEIVLVTVNYRLGIFGFLSTATEKVPGNAGLKDIIEALRWIQGNIVNFGGDPSMVTLAGQSAGAAAVHHLALSKSTDDLFGRYITQSGSAVAPWAIHPPLIMRIRYLMVAKELGCTTNSKVLEFRQYVMEVFNGNEDLIAYNEAVEEDENILSCLSYISPTRLANTMNLFHVWKFNPWCNFGPTVEVNSEDPVITKHPITTIKRGEFRDIPWITGLVSHEGLLKTIEVFGNRELMDELGEKFEKIGVLFLESEEIVDNTTAFVEALTEFYFPSDIDAHDTFANDRNLTEMAGDGMITWPSYRALNYQAELMNSSVYFYLFSYEGTFSSTYMHGIPRRYGVAHFDDMNYLFPCLNNFYADLQLHNTESDWTMVNVMTEMWSSFIKDGIPSARLTPNWVPYQTDYGYMRIGSGRSPDISMEEDFLPIRMGFWEYLMGNVSRPTDKWFLENLNDDDDEPSELEREVSSSKAINHQPYFSYIQNVFAFTIFYGFLLFYGSIDILAANSSKKLTSQ